MAKGSSYEREICRQLSLWWTYGDRDDVFWRTSGSGARATTRTKTGRQTKNHYGDVTAADPIGQPFIDLFTVEVKRGYNHCSIADLLDKPKGAVKQRYEEWLEKIEATAKQAGSFSWLLIVKRDRRKPVVFMTEETFRYLFLGMGSVSDCLYVHGNCWYGVGLHEFLSEMGRHRFEYMHQRICEQNLKKGLS